MSFEFGPLERLWLTSIEEVFTSIRLGRGMRLCASILFRELMEYLAQVLAKLQI